MVVTAQDQVRALCLLVAIVVEKQVALLLPELVVCSQPGLVVLHIVGVGLLDFPAPSVHILRQILEAHIEALEVGALIFQRDGSGHQVQTFRLVASR